MVKKPDRKDSPISKLGEKLKILRKERGLNQGELADRAGINRSYLSNLENGHSSPTIDVLDKITQALGVSMAEVFPDGVIRSTMLQDEAEVTSDEEETTPDLTLEEKHFIYDTDEIFDIYPGLKDFLTDEDEVMLAQPTPEEIDFLKSVRFGRNFKPDKRLYRETLLAYRRRRRSNL